MRFYIAFIIFLFATESVFDLLYADKTLSVLTYSTSTYYYSFLFDVIMIIIGFILILKKEAK